MIKTGMLWYDPDEKLSVKHRVAKAARHYVEKYKKTPVEVLMNPSMITDEVPESIGPLKVVPDKATLPNHFLIG